MKTFRQPSGSRLGFMLAASAMHEVGEVVAEANFAGEMVDEVLA